MADFGEVERVAILPNRVTPGLYVATPDGRIYHGQDMDGVGVLGWVYVGDLVSPFELKIMELEREWPPVWLGLVPGRKSNGLIRVSRRLLRELGIDPDSFR